MITEALRFGTSFDYQVTALRNKITEDTNLIRWDNTYYRVCRESDESVRLTLIPSTGNRSEAVECDLKLRDLYVTWIGNRPFERYASTLKDWRPDIGILDSALSAVRRGNDKKLFELESLLVFCVAESLRNDHVATEIALAFQTASVGLVGRQALLLIDKLWFEAHSWGDASDAVLGVISSDAKKISEKTALKGRVGLSPQERQFSERVADENIRPDLRSVTRRIKVLKRAK